MGDTFFVSLGVEQAAELIDDAVLRGSFTGECIDSYGAGGQGGGFILRVYEKHYMRVSNRLTLTVVIDDLSGTTRVHCVGGGGGEGLFAFDWGAADSFSGTVVGALAPYRI
jgi:hypothetical protein